MWSRTKAEVDALSAHFGVRPLGPADNVREVFRRSYVAVGRGEFLPFKQLEHDFAIYESTGGTLPDYVQEYYQKICVPA